MEMTQTEHDPDQDIISLSVSHPTEISPELSGKTLEELLLDLHIVNQKLADIEEMAKKHETTFVVISASVF